MEPLVLLISGCLVWFICAVLSAVVGRAKNRSGFGWFFMGSFFGPLGLLAAAGMPPQDAFLAQKRKNAATGRSHQEWDPRIHSPCPHCGAINHNEATWCFKCRQDLAPESLIDEWIVEAPVEEMTTQPCPFCAETIKTAAVVCRHCGRDLPKDEDAPPLARIHAGNGSGVGH